jgi:hypothetical protein
VQAVKPLYREAFCFELQGAMDGVQPTRQRKAPPERGQSQGWPAPSSRPLGGLPAGPWLIIGWPECKARPRGAVKQRGVKLRGCYRLTVKTG